MVGDFHKKFDLTAAEAGAKVLWEIHCEKLVAFGKSAVRNMRLVSVLLSESRSRFENHNQTDPQGDKPTVTAAEVD
jgi:hypothetical protein